MIFEAYKLVMDHGYTPMDTPCKSLIKGTMKKITLHIHAMNFPPLSYSNGENKSDGIHIYNQCKGQVIVNFLYL